MEEDKSFKKFKEKILRFCVIQERSEREVMKKLSAWGMEYPQAKELIELLKAHNFLNEIRFATAYAGGKFRQLGWGKRKIAFQLKELALSTSTIQTALDTIDDSDYERKLQKLYQKKLAGYLKEPNDEYAGLVAKQKTIQYLIGRGYEYSLIKKISEG